MTEVLKTFVESSCFFQTKTKIRNYSEMV
jgi:hypothetical protein